MDKKTAMENLVHSAHEKGAFSGTWLYAENGEIVVAMTPEDEATLKRVFFEEDRVRLQPENRTMQPIYAESVTILGKLVALIRQF